MERNTITPSTTSPSSGGSIGPSAVTPASWASYFQGSSRTRLTNEPLVAPSVLEDLARKFSAFGNSPQHQVPDTAAGTSHATYDDTSQISGQGFMKDFFPEPGMNGTNGDSSQHRHNAAGSDNRYHSSVVATEAHHDLSPAAPALVDSYWLIPIEALTVSPAALVYSEMDTAEHAVSRAPKKYDLYIGYCLTDRGKPVVRGCTAREIWEQLDVIREAWSSHTKPRLIDAITTEIGQLCGLTDAQADGVDPALIMLT
jgi:hypothetical protein